MKKEKVIALFIVGALIFLIVNIWRADWKSEAYEGKGEVYASKESSSYSKQEEVQNNSSEEDAFSGLNSVFKDMLDDANTINKEILDMQPEGKNNNGWLIKTIVRFKNFTISWADNIVLILIGVGPGLLTNSLIMIVFDIWYRFVYLVSFGGLGGVVISNRVKDIKAGHGIIFGQKGRNRGRGNNQNNQYNNRGYGTQGYVNNNNIAQQGYGQQINPNQGMTGVQNQQAGNGLTIRDKMDDALEYFKDNILSSLIVIVLCLSVKAELVARLCDLCIAMLSNMG